MLTDLHAILFVSTLEADFDFSATAQALLKADRIPDSVGIAISDTISGNMLITTALVTAVVLELPDPTYITTYDVTLYNQ